MAQKQLLINNPTIGADVEVFISNGYSIVTAEPFCKGGTKHEPYRFKEGNDFFGLSLDNVMMEFSIPPVTTAGAFRENIDEALRYMQSVIPADHKIKASPAEFIRWADAQSEQAKTFGCDPDYNAWKFGAPNPRPTHTSDLLRTCGGHIHIGYDDPHVEVSSSLIRAMDIFVGLPAVVQEPANRRKEMYGKAGAYRIKPYGTEYRTVSNYYINKSELMEQVFENTIKAIDFVNTGVELTMTEGEGVQTAINTANINLAKTMMEYFGVNYVK